MDGTFKIIFLLLPLELFSKLASGVWPFACTLHLAMVHCFLLAQAEILFLRVGP
jgi:hypothetical protein